MLSVVYKNDSLGLGFNVIKANILTTPELYILSMELNGDVYKGTKSVKVVCDAENYRNAIM